MVPFVNASFHPGCHHRRLAYPVCFYPPSISIPPSAAQSLPSSWMLKSVRWRGVPDGDQGTPARPGRLDDEHFSFLLEPPCSRRTRGQLSRLTNPSYCSAKTQKAPPNFAF